MTRTAQSLWLACLGQLQLSVPRPSFNTWLKGTAGLSLENGLLTVAVPSTFASAWLERRMLALVQRVASDTAGESITVVFHVAPHPAASLPQPGLAPAEASQFQESDPWAEDIPLPAHPNMHKTVVLVPRYTFDTFVVGDSNQFAYAAAQAVANDPGSRFNPLFVYSGVGLGKTHLLHAIANRASANGLKPTYVTSEQYTADFIRAIRSRRQDQFRDQYRNTDLLLVDDVQFLEGKEQTQVGFFHTFNELYALNKQIVIACDRPPSAVALLEDRLRSRFAWGLVVDIQPPGIETRTAILQAKAEMASIKLADEVANLIARLSVKSIRELEGYLNKVAALSQFLGKSITPDFVATALRDVFNQVDDLPNTSTPDGLLSRIARHYSTTPASLQRRPSDKKTTEGQRIAMYLLRTLLKLSPEETGLLLGGWNRRTVSNAVKAVEIALDADAAFKSRYDTLIASL